MGIMFRPLKADEIECRISTVNAKGVSLLLYKDARCDMNILDEAVGAMNWQKAYSRDNANCTVSIWDSEKGQWISKEDTGTESFAEKEKGLASDSFKRACFAWGIGRALYTAPFIWIKAGDADIKPHPRKQGEYTCYDKFDVSGIGYDDSGRISFLTISKKGKEVFRFGKASAQKPATTPQKPAERTEAPQTDKITWETLQRCQAALIGRKDKYTVDYVLNFYGITDMTELTEKQGQVILSVLANKTQ